MHDVQKLSNKLLTTGVSAGICVVAITILALIMGILNSTIIVFLGVGLVLGMGLFASGGVGTLYSKRQKSINFSKQSGFILSDASMFGVNNTKLKTKKLYNYDLSKDNYKEDSRQVQKRNGNVHLLDLSKAKVVYLEDDTKRDVIYDRKKVAGPGYYSEDDKKPVMNYCNSYDRLYEAIYEELY